MNLDTKAGLVSVIRKEAALAFEVRDAAQRTAEAAGKVAELIGSKGGDSDEVRRAADLWSDRRSALSATYRRLVDYAREVREAAKV